MGHPQRAESHHAEESQNAASSSCASPIDSTIGLTDWFDEEESEPWCVDNGDGIVVKTTIAIFDGVKKGDLSKDMLAWRDGRACWLPIADCYELTVKPSPKRDPTPISGVRRVRSQSLSPSAPLPLVRSAPSPSSKTPEQGPAKRITDRVYRAAERPATMISTSFAIGVAIGVLLYLPFAW